MGTRVAVIGSKVIVLKTCDLTRNLETDIGAKRVDIEEVCLMIDMGFVKMVPR